MDLMQIFVTLLAVQALMGAFDTVWHHELVVALPRCPSAQLELRIHSVRAVLYAVLFAGLAWYQWHGAWGWVLIALVLIEVWLTLWDFIIEDRTRILPASERVTHTLLAINGGAAFLILALQLPAWIAQPTTLSSVNYGWLSWFLSLSALGVGLSGIRDGFAARALQRLQHPLRLDFGAHQRVLITGGTGFIGSALCRELLRGQHALTVISRRPVPAAMQFGGRVRIVASIAELSPVEVFDVVINLAGAPVVGMPWTPRRKAILLASRLAITEALIGYVRVAKTRPRVWIQASAIGYYGTQAAQALDESSPQGEGFAAELCGQWERLTAELTELGIRRVVLRFGLVFGRSGGALPMMLLPFRFGFGTVVGDGSQRVAWIHLEDLLGIVAWAIREPAAAGVFNVVAPDSPSYAEFARTIGEELHRPVFMRIPAAPMRALLGEMATMLVDGPEILPARLQHAQFALRFPTLRSALMDII